MSMAAVFHWFGRSASDQTLLNAAKSGSLSGFDATLSGRVDLFSKVGELGLPLYEKILRHIFATADFEDVALPMFRSLVAHCVEQYPDDITGSGVTANNMLANFLYRIAASELAEDQIGKVLDVLHAAHANFSQQVYFSAGASADLWLVSKTVQPASECSLLANMYWQLLAQSADVLRWSGEASAVVDELFTPVFLRIATAIHWLEAHDVPALTDVERTELGYAVQLLAGRLGVSVAEIMNPPGVLMPEAELRERDALVAPPPIAEVIGAAAASASITAAYPIDELPENLRAFETILRRGGALPEPLALAAP